MTDASRSEGEMAGWRWVSVEPTEEMVKAAETALSEWRKTLDRDEAMARSYQAHDRKFIASATPEEKHRIRYRAMLSAAPTPPAGSELVEAVARELDPAHWIIHDGYVAAKKRDPKRNTNALYEAEFERTAYTKAREIIALIQRGETT